VVGILDEGRNYEPSETVIGHAPERQERALDNSAELEHEWCCVLGGDSGLVGELQLSLLVETVDLSSVLSEKGRVEVDVRPVTRSNALLRTGSDGIEHVLGGVGLGRAVCAVLPEVADKVLGVRADRAKVDSATATLEEKETVKLFEEKSVRLVDGAQDGLTGSGELLEEANDVVGRLTIETTGRLVEEQQELRLGSELDTDGKTLPGLDTKTIAGETNHRVGNVLHLEQLQDLFNVVVLLALWHIMGLAEVSREPKGLADGASPLVHILLLDVGGTTLEVDAGWAASDESITADDTDGLTVGEDIEESGLSGTGSTHQRSERTRLDVSENVVEELASATRDRDRVAQVLPSEWLTSLDEALKVLLGGALAEGLLALLQTGVAGFGVGVLRLEDSDGRCVGSLRGALDELKANA
jgi:hypothetical protein